LRSDQFESYLAECRRASLDHDVRDAGAMPDRKNFISTLWLTSSLVLLASVLVAPIPTSGLGTGSPCPDHLCRNFALPAGLPSTCISAGMVTNTILRVNALASENEEQDRVGALDELRVSFLIPYSFRKVPDRELIAPLSILSLYPLRC